MVEEIDRSELANDELVKEGSEGEEKEKSKNIGTGGLTDNPMFSTEPSVPISEIEHEHDCPKWAAYLIRMGYKITGSHGTPAIVDGGFGTILGYQHLQTRDTDRSEENEIETIDEGAGTDQAQEGEE